jgi:uncharacterized integral membrane protein (TIGR00698 family)
MASFPGIALAAAAAAAAYGLTALLPQIKVGTVVWAILIGVVAGSAFRPGERFAPGLKFCEKKVLETAVILLGAGLSLGALGGFDLKAGLAVLAAMGLCLAVGPAAAGALGTSRSTGFLLGVGTAICGSAAIAAVSPFAAKDRHETALSIGVVNIWGFLAMLVLPFVAKRADLSVESAALLLGGSLPAVGHAVGAGYATIPAVGSLAIAVKMGRVLCLVPLVLVCSLRAPDREGGSALRGAVPWFVPLFIAAVAMRTLGWIPAAALGPLDWAGKAALTAAMAAVGFGVDLSAVRRHGPKALWLGSGLLALQIAIVGAAAFLLSY